MKAILLAAPVILLAGNTFAGQPVKNENKPNVILILADDQGIGDLGCEGNPWLKTPNIDAFYAKAVRMTDFQVSPLCTPTRSSIMTGQYPINNGAWATFKGRDALTGHPFTMADMFKQNGYLTGMFGKWHLGDNYPVRPTDCGFDEAINFKAGGIGELSDYWGNNYFNDVYYVNNKPQQFEGYCTDVWFSEAMKFIDKNKSKPFFLYLPINAPHDPLRVPEKYAAPYKYLEGKKIISANLYGMIANIDENFGKFNQFLKNEGLTDNTILIYMSDNGTRFGYSRDGKFGYNKGYEGIKGDIQEGGHRVPFFIRWPNGKIEGGKDINDLVAHVDLIPTLAALCKLTVPKKVELDGVDFSPLLLQKDKTMGNRTVFIHHRQDWRPPLDVDKTCISQNNWRLLNGTELYDIQKDRKEKNNLSYEFPNIVQELLDSNERFLQKTKQLDTYNEFPVPVVGDEHQQVIKLTIQHAIGEDKGIWKSEQVAAGMKNTNDAYPLLIESAGRYEIACCRWPKECPGPIWGIPAKNPKNMFHYEVIKPEKVRISISNQIHEKEITGCEEEVKFHVNLPKGKTMLVTDFIEGKDTYGVYYTYIKKVD